MFTDETIEQLITFLPRVMEVNQNKEPVAKAELILAMKTLLNAGAPTPTPTPSFKSNIFSLGQTGFDAPFVILQGENNLGDDIVFAYVGSGQYSITSANGVGIFVENQTFLIPITQIAILQVGVIYISPTQIEFSVFDLEGNQLDDKLIGDLFELRIYPIA